MTAAGAAGNPLAHSAWTPHTWAQYQSQSPPYLRLKVDSSGAGIAREASRHCSCPKGGQHVVHLHGDGSQVGSQVEGRSQDLEDTLGFSQADLRCEQEMASEFFSSPSSFILLQHYTYRPRVCAQRVPCGLLLLCLHSRGQQLACPAGHPCWAGRPGLQPAHGHGQCRTMAMSARAFPGSPSLCCIMLYGTQQQICR